MGAKTIKVIDMSNIVKVIFTVSINSFAGSRVKETIEYDYNDFDSEEEFEEVVHQDYEQWVFEQLDSGYHIQTNE